MRPRSPSPRSPKRRLPAASGRVAPALGAAVVMAFAAWLSAAAGRRGLFAFDQSILFDAAHRMLSGQTPYADFVLPFGPVAPALQALLFGLLGTDYRGYLWSAALGNAAATGLAMVLLRQLLPRRPALWLLGGALTAVWFYPPSGTPWPDQTAFLFVLAGLVLLLPAVLEEETEPRTGWWRLVLAAGSGACLVLAALAKQNAALAALPLTGLVLVVPSIDVRLRGRPVPATLLPAAAWLAGVVVALAGFWTWLEAAADPELFARHAVAIPSEEGLRRLRQHPWILVAVHRVGTGPSAARATVLAAAALGTVAGWLEIRRPNRADKAHRRAVAGGAVALGLFTAQHLFTAISLNQAQISAPFTGILTALAAGLLLARISPDPSAATPRRRAAAVALVTVGTAGAAAVLAVVGVRTAFSRVAQDLFPPGTRFERPLAVPGLAPLLWGEPTLLTDPRAREGSPQGGARNGRGDGQGTTPVTAQEVEALVRTLAGRDGRFFVFPDWTILYGLLDRPAPQPLLWFHEGLTYPREGSDENRNARDALDRWVVRDLERHQVETVVLERISWFGTRSRLDDFPRLAAYVADCFRPETTIGVFEVRTRRPGCLADLSPRERSPEPPRRSVTGAAAGAGAG